MPNLPFDIARKFTVGKNKKVMCFVSYDAERLAPIEGYRVINDVIRAYGGNDFYTNGSGSLVEVTELTAQKLLESPSVTGLRLATAKEWREARSMQALAILHRAYTSVDKATFGIPGACMRAGARILRLNFR